MPAHKPAPSVADLADSEVVLALAHQLKSPTAIIQWCLQSALEQGALDPKSREWIRKALTQASSMGELISDLLHLFKFSRKWQSDRSTLTPINTGTLLSEVAQQFAEVARSRSIKMVVAPQRVVPPILAEPMYLKQALINVVDNAIKYSREGGEVQLEALFDHGEVILNVLDNGIGIPEPEQAELFTEFYRGHTAQGVTQQGSGLGLVFVKHVVEAFGGSVAVESQLNKGTRVSLRFPEK